jgi:hypothetical protein
LTGYQNQAIIDLLLDERSSTSPTESGRFPPQEANEGIAKAGVREILAGMKGWCPSALGKASTPDRAF